MSGQSKLRKRGRNLATEAALASDCFLYKTINSLIIYFRYVNNKVMVNS